MDTEGKTVTYWAFLSYSHADNREDGRKWADWLHDRLETFVMPEGLAGDDSPLGFAVPERLFPIFQDEKELPASAELGAKIEAALDVSRNLIVICSPRSASSLWVNEEVSYFKRLGREDRIFPLIIAGEPNASEPEKPNFPADSECFCQALRYKFDENGTFNETSRTEPMAANVRSDEGFEATTDDDTHAPILERAVLRIVAGILGVGFDELYRRDQRRKEEERQAALEAERRRAHRNRILAGSFAILALLAMGAFFYARVQQGIAEAERSVAENAKGGAESLINDMMFELKTDLEDMGLVSLLKDVSVSAERYFTEIPENARNETTEANRGVMLLNRAEVLIAEGDFLAALPYAEESVAVLSAQAPNERSALNGLARALFVKALVVEDPEESNALFDEALKEAREGAERPGTIDADWKWMELQILDSRIRLAIVSEDFAHALTFVDRAQAMADDLAFSSGDERFEFSRAQVHMHRGQILLSQGLHGDARRPLEYAQRLLTKIIQENPNAKNMRQRVGLLAFAWQQLGIIYSEEGRWLDFKNALGMAISIYEDALAERDAFERLLLEEQYISALMTAVTADKLSIGQEEKRELLNKAFERAVKVASRDPLNTEWATRVVWIQSLIAASYLALNPSDKDRESAVQILSACRNQITVLRDQGHESPGLDVLEGKLREGLKTLLR